MEHTKEDWVIIKNHPVFEYSTLIMADMKPSNKSIDKGKLICRIDDVRGDSFTRLEPEEREANIQLIASAQNMIHELSEINFYAKTALKSLDNQSLTEVRGMLMGIIVKSNNFIK